MQKSCAYNKIVNDFPVLKHINVLSKKNKHSNTLRTNNNDNKIYGLTK